MCLSFLPQKLYLEGSFDKMLMDLYDIFEKDIAESEITYKGLDIAFDDNYIDDSLYPEGFWHLITRGGSTDRLIDFKRAKRIVWLRPLIENSDAPELLKWKEKAINKKGVPVWKTYIWYREGRYIVILTKKPCKYFLTTAFYVTGERNDQYYLRKYEKAQKKGPGC